MNSYTPPLEQSAPLPPLPQTVDPVALESARKKAYWRLLPMLFISYLVAYVDRQNVAIAKLTMMQDLPNFDNAVIGFGAGIFFWGYFLLEVPGTLIVEKWSARKWLTRIMITWGIMAALTAVVRTPMQFYAVRFCLGLAEAGFFPGVIVYLTHWFTTRDRARALAIFFVASPLAQIVSPLINQWLLPIGVDAQNLANLNIADATPIPAYLGLVGWQWIYILWGIPAVLMAGVLYCFLTDKPRQAKWLSQAERDALEAALSNERMATAGAGNQNHRALSGLLNPRVWILAAAMFCTVTATYAVEFFMPTILLDWYGMDIKKLTWLIILPPALAMIAQPANAWSSDHFNERRWHAVLPLLIAAGCMALLPWSQGNLTVTVVLFMIVLAGTKAYMPAFWSMPNLFLVNAAAAGSIGFINSVGNLGGFMGPSITGYLEKTTGSFHASLYILAGFIVVSATLIYLIASKCKAYVDPTREVKK
jgi:ACS family tartrate transporter-like MFS transporter